MPKQERGKRTITLPVKVNAEEKAALAEIAEAQDRPVGYVLRELMLRGLAAYHRDGLLKESPADNGDGRQGGKHKVRVEHGQRETPDRRRAV